MQKLALVYRAQYHASENHVTELIDLVATELWVVNQPWTAQGWLPITQAACARGGRETIEFLLSAGADLTLLVGDLDDQPPSPIWRSPVHTHNWLSGCRA